ncbi:SIMPL domain-containing protein [Streptomyces sp. NPDC051561]|uniref:SIMPL domain-containing protein n=1 Tax=Streptomyces sp. NPDC051561 TaxID=3365658 RepID=UPI0037973DF9
MSVPLPTVSRALTVAALTGGLLVTAALPAVAQPALGAVAAGPAAAVAARPVPSTITVTGEGAATATPDLAIVNVGVETTAPTAKAALAAQTKAAGALLAAVRKAGVADRDVRTESLSLNAVYQPGKDGGSTTKVTGYQAGQTFSVRVRDLARTGSVIQAAMDAAGEAGRIGGVDFDVADPTALRTEARKAAHLDARAKAEQHARLSGRELGRLVSVNESDSGRHRPMAMPAGAFADEGVSVAPGEVRDEIVLTAVYELD